jgi:L-asparaginase II
MSSPSPTLLAEVTRGPAVESRHFGHVVVVNSAGEVLFAAGDPDRPIFPRSSLKPLQALAGIARGTAEAFDFTPAEIAVTCASHAAEPRHRSAVAGILRKIGASEADLRCGPHPVGHLPTRDELIRAGRQPTPIYSNCSGKHSGMLALARALEAPLAGYWEGDHPVQREIQRILAEACGTDLGSLRWGIDGCGVPTYLMPLRQLALGFARLADPTRLSPGDAEAARKITAAMTAEPWMVSGEEGFDSHLMHGLPGVVVSKGGAEGCEAVGLLGRGIGIAMKAEDGSNRAVPPVILSLIRRFAEVESLPESLEARRTPVVRNTRDEVVGEVRSCI